MPIFKSKTGKKYAVICEQKKYTANVITNELNDINSEMIEWIKENYIQITDSEELLSAKENIRKIVENNYQFNLF